jgi:hypothetical protein
MAPVQGPGCSKGRQGVRLAYTADLTAFGRSDHVAVYRKQKNQFGCRGEGATRHAVFDNKGVSSAITMTKLACIASAAVDQV